MYGRSTLYVKNKWEVELNIVSSEDDWHYILKTQHTSTSSKRWKKFGWKNVNPLFYYTTKFKQLGRRQYCWRQC